MQSWHPADFFTSGLNLKLPVAICGMIAIYILSYFFWGFIWLLVYWYVTIPSESDQKGVCLKSPSLYRQSGDCIYVRMSCQYCLKRRHDKTCVAGFEKRYHGVVSAFMFATETQQTIGEASATEVLALHIFYVRASSHSCSVYHWAHIHSTAWSKHLSASPA